MAWLGGALAIGTIAGFALAVSLVRTEIQVDYDSGAIRDVVSIGPVTVREGRHMHGFFGSIRMPNGRTALNDRADWHTALSFRGNAKVSPNFEAGQVLNDIVKLEQLPWRDPTGALAVVKQQFLETISKGGVQAASGVVRAAEQQVLEAWTNPPAMN
jgi:hypothetical protein